LETQLDVSGKGEWEDDNMKKETRKAEKRRRRGRKKGKCEKRR
jgi:hypothetical protein